MTHLGETSDRFIRRASTTAIVTFALLLTGTAGAIAWPRLAHTLGVKPPAPMAAYQIGQRVDVPAAWYEASPYTVVLFASSACGACQTAQPFLKQLVTNLKGRANVVLATKPGDAAGDGAYGRDLGLKETAIRTIDEPLNVRSTPTLVLVNQRGEILGAWEGVGPSARQQAIASAIERATGL
jgi:thiol-disulfide isomerase/thioredoxin